MPCEKFMPAPFAPRSHLLISFNVFISKASFFHPGYPAFLKFFLVFFLYIKGTGRMPGNEVITQ